MTWWHQVGAHSTVKPKKSLVSQLTGHTPGLLTFCDKKNERNKNYNNAEGISNGWWLPGWAVVTLSPVRWDIWGQLMSLQGRKWEDTPPSLDPLGYRHECPYMGILFTFTRSACKWPPVRLFLLSHTHRRQTHGRKRPPHKRPLDMTVGEIKKTFRSSDKV